MSSKFSGAFVSLLVTIFAGCSPEPAWPDTSILRASLPSDFGSMAVNDKSTLKVFFDLESAFFSEEAEGAWLGFKDLDGYEYYALPEKTMEDLSPKVHLAMKGVVRWHKQQLELDPGYLTGDFESYTEMAIHWGAKELELLFQVCWEEQELMDAFVHAAQIAWSNGTGIGSEVFCKGVWQWLDQEPSLSQEEKDELLLRYPLRLDAGYMRFRGDLMNWVGFWEGLTRERQRELGESNPYRNKLDYLDEAILLVNIANKDLPLSEQDRQTVRESEFWKDRFRHLEFMQEIWIPRFAMQ